MPQPVRDIFEHGETGAWAASAQSLTEPVPGPGMDSTTVGSLPSSTFSTIVMLHLLASHHPLPVSLLRASTAARHHPINLPSVGEPVGA